MRWWHPGATCSRSGRTLLFGFGTQAECLSFPPSRLQECKEKHVAAKKEYEQALTHFFESRPADQILEQKLSPSLKNRDPKKPPVYPLPAFYLYVEELQTNPTPATASLKYKELVKKASEDWEILPNSQKIASFLFWPVFESVFYFYFYLLGFPLLCRDTNSRRRSTCGHSWQTGISTGKR